MLANMIEPQTRESATQPSDEQAWLALEDVLEQGNFETHGVLGPIEFPESCQPSARTLIAAGWAGEVPSDSKNCLRLAPARVCEVVWSQDAQRVWVNAPDGSCIGRFDRRGHVDVHRTMHAQIQGQPECLACAHEGTPDELWAAFKASMLEHYQIEVGQPD